MRRQTVIIMINPGDNAFHSPFFHLRGSRSMRWGGMMFCKFLKIMRPNLLNCLDVWTSPYCMFDARHVDVRHTTSSSDMSYGVCRMSMSRICHRSKILVAGGVHLAVQCYSRLHTIGLQLCRHGMGARLTIYQVYTNILKSIWSCLSLVPFLKDSVP
jgi:hypothetical protein